MIIHFILAAQMALLARLLPFMTAHKIPEDDRFWVNFLLLLNIADLLMAPQITHDEVAYLQLLVQEHHEEFVALYPEEVVTPKMHYMVHMPDLILMLVSLYEIYSTAHNTCILHVDSVHWCITGQCAMKPNITISKKLAQNVGNFINLSWTLTLQHQQWHCYQWMMPGTQDEIDVGPGTNNITQY